MKEFALNNGDGMPAVGLGTFLMKPQDAEAAVKAALASGYSLIDTANAYMNEKAVGRGIKASGKARSEIFLSTKLWPSVYGRADEAIDETLRRLQTDYIDLLFLHQPIGEVEHAYEAMERAVREGKIRAIGLSNFSEAVIRNIAVHACVKPAVIQTEAHPYFPQEPLKEAIRDFDAILMAWYPLGHGDKSLLAEPVFERLAKTYGKSVAQIILRWHTQLGHVVIPGSRNPEHIRANIDLFDFELTQDDMNDIATVDREKRYYTATKEALEGYLSFAPDFDAQE
ncbi:MAG: aldo/keto reductase [Veillonellaceae bacterium]|nr:aldo/keto reductase [Veillonellaceae bacterium]